MILDIAQPKVLPPDSVWVATENLITHLQQDPQAVLHSFVQSAIMFGLKVLVALLIYIVGSWLIGRVRKLMQRGFERRKTEKTIASFASSAVSIGLTVLLVIVTVGTLGVDTTSLAALLAAGGMAIGMALSGTVQNFAGGIMILAFKPFKAGDWISALGIGGTVIEVTITSTKILTPDNRVVVLPNGSLSNGVIDNYTGRPLRRVEWLVSVEYGSDAEACKKAILEIVGSDTRVLDGKTDTEELYKEFDVSKYQLATIGYKSKSIPDPFVALKSLNENDITFVVRAWVRSSDYWDVYFEINERFYTELPKQGFGFAYPHVVVEKSEK